jgi:capsular polysaccharide biosynthesis protein
MDTKDSLLDIIPILYKRRKFILGMTLLAFVASVIVSLTLPNYYKSSTIFYPASTDLAKPLPLGSVDKTLTFFGSDRDIDRLLSIAKSNELMEYLIKEFDLYSHYQIDSTSDKSAHKIRLRLSKLYQVQKTKYDAIELSIEDQNPQMAAEIATKARQQIDERAQSLIKESQKQLLDYYHNNIVSKISIVKKITDSLVYVRDKYGIYNTGAQSEVLSTLQAETEAKLLSERAKLKSLIASAYDRDSINYITAIVSGLGSQLKNVNANIDKFSGGLQDIINLSREEGSFITQLNLDKVRYRQLSAAHEAHIPSIHLVQEAEVPIIKSRPKRSVYVLGASFLAFAFTVLLSLVQHAFKGIRWKE